jgi:putative ABC transport system permease protein
MPFSEAFKLALQSLWANKLRSILTLIGVVMGVASVIMVITLVNGANRYVSTKISGYGADVLDVSRMPSVIFSSQDYFRFQKRKILRMDDYHAVRDSCMECSEVGATLSKSTNVVYNGHSSNNSQVHGDTWNMLPLTNIDIALGRGFTPADDEHSTHDAIIGYDIVDNLMGDSDPIGKEIRVDGIPYTVVGVGERQGKTLGQSQDNWVAVPISTYQEINGYNDSIDIMARVGGGANAMDRAEDEVRVLMRSRRHDAPGTPDDFEIETNDTFLDIWKQISSLFASVVLGLASIALVVGGVVIMNIMLVSVTERTREIGVRVAVGAKRRHILWQFLAEALALSLAGGLIGVTLGLVAAQRLAVRFGWPMLIRPEVIALAVGFSAAVGIGFGLYPARKASRLDPIMALRYE